MRLLKDTDFKATIVDSTWNCLPVTGQDENSVALLDITRAGTTQTQWPLLPLPKQRFLSYA